MFGHLKHLHEIFVIANKLIIKDIFLFLFVGNSDLNGGIVLLIKKNVNMSFTIKVCNAEVQNFRQMTEFYTDARLVTFIDYTKTTNFRQK